jgi:hypothetical protein
MPRARIYQPAKSAMQSGRRNTCRWVLEFEPSAKAIDPLMGWTESADTRNQIRMKFATKEAALAFAEKNGLEADVFDPRARRIRPKSYASNFRSALSS